MTPRRAISKRMARVRQLILLPVAIAILASTPHAALQGRQSGWAGAPGARVLLDAHNCYPDGGRWADRIDRALATGLPVAIEQDLVWFRDPRSGVSRSILSHGEPFTGTEPSLATHFFERIRPLVEQALREGRRETWPLVVLNLDLKTNEPEHHAAIWETLGTYADVAHDGGARRRWQPPGAARRQAGAGADRQPRRAAGGLPRSRPGRRAPARVRRHPGRSRSQGGEGQGGDPEAGRAEPGRADRERRDQLSPLGELPVGGGRARRPGRGRRVDARRRGAARGALRAGAQPRPVDPLLHAQRPRRGRRPRLDGELQLRHRPPPSRRAGARPATPASTSSPPTSTRGWRAILARPAAQSATPPGDRRRPQRRRSARASRDAASRCCRTAGASRRPAGTCRPATSRWR